MRLEVGYIAKAHGVMGEVVVKLITDRHERVEPGAVLFYDGGSFTVDSSRPHQDRFLVKFREITSREQAYEARGTTLMADAIDDPDAIWIHDLIGKPVVDTEGEALGTVESVLENPASDLLELDGGELIPLTFYVEQRDDGTIVVDPPEGLFDPIDADGS